MPRGGRPLVTANSMPASRRRLTAATARSVRAFSWVTSVPSTSASTILIGGCVIVLEPLAFSAPVAADQRVRGGVVLELRLGLALELGDDRLGQRLAELDAPLVEGVDVPDRALSEDAVLIQRHQRPEDRAA